MVSQSEKNFPLADQWQRRSISSDTINRGTSSSEEPHTDPGHRREQNEKTRRWREDKSGSLSKMESNLGDGHKKTRNWHTLLFSTQGCPELHNNDCMPQMVVLGDRNDHYWTGNKPVQGASDKYWKPLYWLTTKELAVQGLLCSPDGKPAEAKSSAKTGLDWNQPAADSAEVNGVNASLQMMSTAAVDETSSEEVLSPRPRPFRPEAPQCRNYIY